MVRSAVEHEHPIYALLAQFRIMSAIGAPLSAWEAFHVELEREQQALHDAGDAAVDAPYREELATVLASVREHVEALRRRG